MFFHIDESGNTGNNLFDTSQPLLSYGVLSSRTNIDALGGPIHKEMLSILGVDILHASQLGEDRIEKISPQLRQLHEKMQFEFGFYFIEKKTYALVQLFEAVFDAGLNEAVPWIHYWTPMRFLIIRNLLDITDDDFLKKSWDLSSAKNIEKRYPEVIELLTELQERASAALRDARLREIFLDALAFGIKFPDKLDFGTKDQKIISPNAVGFQFVISQIANQIRKKNATKATAITMDYQQQFNGAQLKTHKHQKLIAEGLRKSKPSEQRFILEHPLYRHLTRHEILGREIPTQAPVVSRSVNSIGLQIVDLYLWIVGRAMKGEALHPGTHALARSISRKMTFDGIWIHGMESRWTQFERELPDFENLSEDQLKMAAEQVRAHRAEVAAMNLPFDDGLMD
ncbi:MAG: DUF3800 domain-containing protein [Xanthomonadales bacterium]|nr:DUF3800 domain-containing protein [Xanthomonadales bacterium]